MKKLIIIFTLLSLITSLTFAADLSIGGRAFGVAQVLGNSEYGVGDNFTEPWTRWSDDIRILFMLNNNEGTAGAAFRLTGSVWGNLGVNWFKAWWQPHDMFYFSLGKIQEGRKYNPEPLYLDWGIAGKNEASDMNFIQFVPWERYQGIGPHNDNIFMELKAQSDRVGMQASFIPIDSLHLTLVWNGFESSQVYSSDHSSAKNVFIDRISANVSYTTPVGGQASVFFANAPEGGTRKLGLMYTQHIINPLYAEVTGLLPLPDEGDIPFVGAGLGLGYRVNRQINVNARFAAEIGLVNPEYNGLGELIAGHSTKIGLDIAPSFEIDWSMKVYLHLGFAMDLDAELTGWSVCPYFVKDAGWVSFWAGFKIWADNTPALRAAPGEPSISWGIPIALMFLF